MNPFATSIIGSNEVKSQDSAIWDEVRRIFSGFERTAFAKELKAVFENLHDEELLEALQQTRWTGRPGYPIKVMWRTIIASHVFDIPTIEGLRRRLEEPFLAILCGIYSDKEIPSRFAYYRFIGKLIAHRDLIEKCMAKTINVLREQLPEFARTVVVDSTDVPTYSRRYKRPPSDPDAGWGFKKNSNGEDYQWLGYKVHLLADAKYEIPLVPIVTPANANDSPLMMPVLDKNKALINNFSPKYILGDKGYDAKENYRAVVEDFKAVPVIDMNIRGRKGKTDQLMDIADDRGTPLCAWGIPMIFWGYDKKQKNLKYRCPLACGKKGCTWMDKCSKSDYGHVAKVKLQDDYRRFIQIPRHTNRWKIIYNKRTSIERIFSRLKKDSNGKLINHRIRGLSKITINCLLNIWVMQVKSVENLDI